MKQNWCYECGVPVKDRRNRDSGLCVFFCLMCAGKDGEEYVRENGVYYTYKSFSPSKRLIPHYPRWNYPSSRSYKP